MRRFRNPWCTQPRKNEYNTNAKQEEVTGAVLTAGARGGRRRRAAPVFSLWASRGRGLAVCAGKSLANLKAAGAGVTPNRKVGLRSMSLGKAGHTSAGSISVFSHLGNFIGAKRNN